VDVCGEIITPGSPTVPCQQQRVKAIHPNILKSDFVFCLIDQTLFSIVKLNKNRLSEHKSQTYLFRDEFDGRDDSY
jgi:hypothetical protein